jgi:competence protein ComEC
VRGAVKIVTPPSAPGTWLAAGAYVQGLRDAIDARIRSVLAGDPGAIASALITGKRDAITPAVYDAMFVSGIGHVLSISGYHMAVVAGIVFFVVRAILALVPDSRTGRRSRNGLPSPRFSSPRSISSCPAPRSRPSAPLS